MNSESFGKTLPNILARTFVIFAIALIGFTQPVAAQFTIEIGISRDKAVKRMVDLGYTQIQILRKGFKTIQAQACLDGTRYQVRIADGYKVSNVAETGVCRNSITAESLERNLANSGFTRIVIDTQNGNYIALACRNQNRVRIIYSRQGEVLSRRQIGRCEEIFQPNDVRQVLRKAGYDRIKFIDRQLPWYRAEACQGNRRLELLLTRFGEVRRSTRIGDCTPPLRPNRIAQHLEKQGYAQVEILDRELPSYRATACRDNKRLELELNRFGEITSRDTIGKCRRALDEEEITQLLREEGFTRINVKPKRNGSFEISSCLDGYQKFATISAFGELLEERDGNRCKPRTVSKLFNDLKNRNFKEIEFYAEACKRGRKIRIYYDQNGDRIRRENRGAC